MDNKNNVWQDPEIIEMKDELTQEKIDGNLGRYGSIGAGCTICY